MSETNALAMDHTSSVIHTLDGRVHNLHNRVAADFEASFSVEHIAKILSQNNRWNGNTIIPVDVAWHSIAVFKNILATNVEVMKQMTPQAIIWLLLKGLFHDAPEIITGDVSRPYKQYLKDSSNTVENAIHNLESTLEDACKHAILEDMDKYGKEINSSIFLEFASSMQKKSELWDNLNTIGDKVKKSDHDVAEIENWLWRSSHVFGFPYLAYAVGDSTQYREIVHSVTKSMFEGSESTKSVVNRYWFPIPEYVHARQMNIFHQQDRNEVNIEFTHTSRRAFIATHEKIRNLIHLFAKNIKYPMDIELGKEVKSLDYMKYFFSDFDEDLHGI